MKATFFTTLSESYWQEIAKHTLPSWVNLNSDVVVFLEKHETGELDRFLSKNSWIRVLPISKTAIEFHSSIPQSVRDKSRPFGGKYNHRFDIDKFSWPLFAFAHALRVLAGPIVWLDSDVIVKNITGLFDYIFPGDSEATYLGRTKHPPECPYTESGLLGFRMNHAKSEMLADALENYVLSGAVYKLGQWHDCTVYDAVRKDLSTRIRYKSISRDEGIDPVFRDSLGQWMIHYWGKRLKEEFKQTAR